MKNQIISLIIFIFSVQFINAQCPTAPITFVNQAQVNAFPTSYPSCTVIPDGIDIKIMGADISNLIPLSQLTSVLGVLEIRNCPLLATLNGLNNITAIGNDTLDGFILRDLPALTTLAALNNLDSIHGEFTIRTCNVLTTLNGLNGLKKAYGSVIIRDNATLQNLNGLDSLIYIGETLELVQNTQLNSIAALSHVDTIVGGVEGGIFIEANDSLSNLTGLGNGNTSVGSNLDITLNGNLNLCHVPSICKYLANPPAGATITITANKVDCNSEAEIIAKCALGTSENINFGNTITVYPNPLTENFTIDSKNNEELKIEIVNLFGTVLDTFMMKGYYEGEIANYSPGIYLLKVTGSNRQEKVIRIVKQ